MKLFSRFGHDDFGFRQFFEEGKLEPIDRRSVSMDEHNFAGFEKHGVIPQRLAVCVGAETELLNVASQGNRRSRTVEVDHRIGGGGPDPAGRRFGIGIPNKKKTLACLAEDATAENV